MHALWKRMKGLLLLLVFCGLVQACNCETQSGRRNDTTIEFLEPRSTLMLEGKVRVKVEDFDGFENIKILVDGKVIKETKPANKEAELTIDATFDLEAQPEEFTIRVETIDTLEEKANKSLSVRRDTGPPSIKIVLPKKLDDKHAAIFVGKNFKTACEASDTRDGVKEIAMTFKLQSGQEEDLKKCAGTSTPVAKDRCEADVDISDDTKFPEGALVIQAVAVDVKNNVSIQDQLQVVVDKTGPQIRIQEPLDGQQLTGLQSFSALVLDQVGVKKVEFFVGTTALQNVNEDTKKPGQYVTAGSVAGLGSGTQQFKVVAEDNLGNKSEATVNVKLGCQSDADCAHKPGTRCCLSKSATNGDGTKTGTCFPTQTKEGDLCDPCTQPCGKGTDGKLMGCLPQPCTDKPPYRCRPACNLGNPNRAADNCRPADPSTGRPAEYCARSDITKIDSSLGSCAIGHNCDPLNHQTCSAGAQPPYNKCCPAGMICYPADADANFCVPEGQKKEGEQNCQNDICGSQNSCGKSSGGKSMVCVVSVDQTGRPVGAPKCNVMCDCNSLCRAGIPSTGGCPQGSFCTPLRLTNGNVPLPMGACVTP